MRWELLSLAIVLLMFAEDIYVEANHNLFSSKKSKTSKASRKHSKSTESGKSSSQSKGKATKNSKSKKTSHKRSQEPPTNAPSVSPTCLECDDGPNQRATELPITEQPVPYSPDVLTDDWIGDTVALVDGEIPQDLEQDGESLQNLETSKPKNTSGYASQKAVSLLGLGGICLLSLWIIM